MYNIYKITNKLNGKFYIGVTKSKYRFSQHISRAHTLNENKPLYNSIRKHGEENFKYDIIESGKDYENGWKIREPYYIKKLKPDYNLTSGGDGIRDYKMPRHIVERVTRKNTGKKRTQMTKDKISNALKGMVIPKEARDNMRTAALNSKNIKQRADHLNKKLTCLRCGIITTIGNITRWGHAV